MEMRKITKFCIAISAVIAASCSEHESLYGVEEPLATGHAGSRVLSMSSRSLVFEHDFILYDEKGVLNASKFAMEESSRSIGNGNTVQIKLKKLELVSAESLGCYSVGVLTEQNAMERPERPEQLARYIFKNTPACGEFTLGVYPERDATLFPISSFKIFSTAFENNGTKYDQNLGAIAYNNHQLFEKGTDAYESQLSALNAMTKAVEENSLNENKNVFVMYQNFSGDNTTLSVQIRDYAIANNIRINAIKNDFSTNDVLLRIAHATGGIYFMPDDYDPFHAPTKSDYYPIAVHADKFLSGQYSFYRATYELTTNVDYFENGNGLWLTMRAILDQKRDDDNLVKLVPCYVQIP